MKLKMLITAMIVSLFLAACGGGGGEADSQASTPEADQPAAKAGPTGTAVINGSIAYDGDAPKPRRIKQDQECKALHGDEVVLADNVVVNDNGTLKHVFVYVKEGVSGSYPPPSEPVVFDQKGCMYDPHVFGVQAGQDIKILNSDPMLHNINAKAEVNRPFNFGMPKQNSEQVKSFKKAEVMVYIKCDVHPWMGAYCGVVDHPFFSVSGDDGSFSINNLPAGNYVVEAWHEQFGSQTMNVTVADGETKAANFTYATK